MNLIINVEIMGGTSTSVAAKEMVDLSKKLGVVIISSFNGVHMSTAGCDTTQEVLSYYEKSKSNPALNNAKER